jgi:hypothetical protein
MEHFPVRRTVTARLLVLQMFIYFEASEILKSAKNSEFIVHSLVLLYFCTNGAQKECRKRLQYLEHKELLLFRSAA